MMWLSILASETFPPPTIIMYEMNEEIEVHMDAEFPNATPPTCSGNSSMLQIYSAMNIAIQAGQSDRVPVGFRLSVPAGICGRFSPTRATSARSRITVYHDVIDINYRQPLSVLLHNHGNEPFLINAGDRIAQITFERVITPRLIIHH